MKTVPSFLQAVTELGNFTEAELEWLASELEEVIFEKDEVVLEKGGVCSWLLFIVEGGMVQYQLDEALEKRVIDLRIPTDWVIEHQSFTAQRPSEYTLQAYQKTKVLKLDLEGLHRLIARSQAFLQMGRILKESADRLQLFDQDLTPDEKYQYILEKRPGLLQQFPQKWVASYVKITPETLSRVRARWSKK